ncbi:TrbI/VirB10 family protein [Sphingomonas sp. CJ99]
MSDTIQSGDTAPPAKVDPETLVLRAQPAPTIRFKRGLVIGLAGFAILAIVLTAWLALSPPNFKLAGAPDEFAEPAKATGDALDNLPLSYADAPKLGPPLPGDLGRPILKHQQSIAADMATQPDAREQSARSALEQAAAERKAARESALLVQTGTLAVADEALPPMAVPAPVMTDTPKSALDLERDPNAQQRKMDFMQASDSGGGVSPHRIRPAASPYLLSAGSVIAASLITGLRSDLPGLVTAQVTEPVFDSATGRIPLIPQVDDLRSGETRPIPTAL